MKLRNMNRADARACIRIIDDALGSKYAKKARQEILLGFSKKAEAQYRTLERQVLVVEGRVVGLCGLFAYASHLDCIGVGWFAVGRKHQGKGLGTKLMNHMIRQARNLGEKRLFVWATQDAVGFYRKFGFRTSRKIVLPKEADVFMAKRL